MNVRLSNGLNGTISAQLFEQPLEVYLEILFTNEALINGVDEKKAKKILTDLYNEKNGISGTPIKAKKSESGNADEA